MYAVEALLMHEYLPFRRHLKEVTTRKGYLGKIRELAYGSESCSHLDTDAMTEGSDSCIKYSYELPLVAHCQVPRVWSIDGE